MEITIRKMKRGDEKFVLDMMKKFFSSPATITDGSEKIFAANVKNCLDDSTCADGFVFVDGEKIIGYAVTAKSYSTEFGGECIWLEDIFVEEEYRGRGVGSKFLRHVKKNLSAKNFSARIGGGQRGSESLQTFRLPRAALSGNGLR